MNYPIHLENLVFNKNFTITINYVIYLSFFDELTAKRFTHMHFRGD